MGHTWGCHLPAPKWHDKWEGRGPIRTAGNTWNGNTCIPTWHMTAVARAGRGRHTHAATHYPGLRARRAGHSTTAVHMRML